MKSWYKFTPKSAAGLGEPVYRYIQAVNAKDMENWIEVIRETMEDNRAWSSKFRGIQVEKIKTPPIEWLKLEIAAVKADLKSKRAYLVVLEGLMP